MPYALLLFATLLAACTSAPYLPPVRIPSERPVADQAKPAKVTVASLSATTSPPLVYGKNAVGHRNFSNAKKILPDIFARMEEDFYCGCPYVKTVVNFASCHFQPRKNPIRAGRIEWDTSCRPGCSGISASAGSKADAKTAPIRIRCTRSPKVT